MDSTPDPRTRRREARERVRAAREAALTLLEQRRAELRRDLERRSAELAGEHQATAA